MRLYRAISSEERNSIDKSGALTVGPNSCQGKHFATRIGHARQWGERLHPNGFVILEVEIPDRFAADLYFVGGNLDMIGPAYFADESQLHYCRIETVHE